MSYSSYTTLDSYSAVRFHTIADTSFAHAPSFSSANMPTSSFNAFLHDTSLHLNEFTIGNPAIAHSSVLERAESAIVNVDYSKDGVLHLLDGKRGGKQVGLNGYIYSHDRRKTLADGTVNRYWQCIKKNDDNIRCTARLITSSEEVPAVIREPVHSHEPNETDVSVSLVKTKILANAITEESAGSVVRKAILSTDDTVKANLPTLDNLKNTVRRKRRKINHHPINPETAADIVIPQHYQVDHAGRRFLLADKVTNNSKRVLVFATDTGLDCLQAPDATVAFVDGTFKCAPINFTQILVIRTKLATNTVPAAYCFLEDKSQSSYKLALEEIKSAAPLWNPNSVVLDYELAELNAVRDVLQTSRRQGCHFHYCQCLMKRLELGNIL